MSDPFLTVRVMDDERRRQVDEIVVELRRGNRPAGVIACGPFGGELPGQVTDPYIDAGEGDQSYPWDGA